MTHEGSKVTDLAERPKLAGTARSVPDIQVPLPGPKARKHVAFDHEFTSPSLPRAYPLVPVRGTGSTVEDIDGNLLLDFTAGIAVSSTGYAHPRITAALEKQARDLIHFSASDFYLPIYAELAAKLVEISPIKGPARAFIGNSGAEAIEAGIKLARFATGRQYLVAFIGGFHGRTYGAVTLTASKSKYHAGFGPMLPGVYHVPFGNAGLDELENRVFKRLIPANEIAAIVVEPIQGEGGYIVPEDGFLQGLRDLCDRHGILLVADEVQSGMGRTGRWWAIQHAGVEPDIITTAKGIASGMPLGAFIARDSVMTWPAGAHGSTFAGNPICAAAGKATMDLIEGGLMENAARMGARLRSGIEKVAAEHGHVRDVRGEGLMLGIEFGSHAAANAVELECFERGLLVLECGEATIRLCPPLIVDEEAVDTAVRLFAEAIAAAARPLEGMEETGG